MCLMRTSIARNLMAGLFETKQTVVSEAINTVAKVLDQEFVSFYLGYRSTHISREDAIVKHVSRFYNRIFDQRDDTLKITTYESYLLTEKPGNFEEQRKTYSGLKHRN